MDSPSRASDTVVELERCDANEQSWSYAQLSYIPPVPSVGKLRSSSLLVATLAHEGWTDHMLPLCASARREFGLERTVWGVKMSGEDVSCELYWYDHSDFVPLTLARIRSVVEPYLAWPELPMDPEKTFWSISIDINPSVIGDRSIDGVHIYVPRPSFPPTCASYHLTPTGLRFENAYFLFREDDMREQAMNWIKTSLIAAGSEHLLADELFPCSHVALAHKPERDGFYFGGLPGDRCADFLEMVDSPTWATELFRRTDGEHEHLLIDVGLDLTSDADGRPMVTKRAFHGVW